MNLRVYKCHLLDYRCIMDDGTLLAGQQQTIRRSHNAFRFDIYNYNNDNNIVINKAGLLSWLIALKLEFTLVMAYIT